MKTLRTFHFSGFHQLNLHPELRWTLLIALLAIVVILLFPSRAFGSEQVIYTFTGGNDGSGPTGLIQDSAGNLYGTAFSGGPEQAGTVFELSPPAKNGDPWTETTLHTFLFSQGQGIGPAAGLVADGMGNLYGTTWLGGPASSGLVFELSPPPRKGGTWTYQVLYAFPGSANDGTSPVAPLAMDSAGNLYGTTQSGGTGGCAGGCGIVFRLAPPSQPGGVWTETILYNFPGTFPGNGGTPGGVTLDAKGGVYGTTVTHGGGPAGTVFRLSPPKGHGTHWNHALLYAFGGFADGAIPSSGVVFDQNGNLYGVTAGGGAGTNCFGSACGTVYELTPTPHGRWTHNVIYTFGGGTDGGYPQSGVILDAAGNVYGTTLLGGGTSCNGEGCGTVFQLSPAGGAWSETILHSFAGGSDGVGPGGLLLGEGNVIYGVAALGADSAGLAFEVTH